MSSRVCISKKIGWFQDGRIQVGHVVRKLDGKRTIIKNQRGEELTVFNTQLRVVKI